MAPSLHYELRQNGISAELLNILTGFLDSRTQRVILNGKYFSWAKVEAGVPQGSILGLLLFLIYINDLSDNLASNPKLFKNVDTSNIDLNNDLKKIGEWAFQWKMSFNPDLTKQAQELIFSRKVQMGNHPPLFFNENVIPKTTLQKHLGMFLDSKLNFSEHLKTIFQKPNKTIGLLRKLQTLLPKPPLITIYKWLIRSHLDYGDMIYDQTFNMSFQQKMESIQYNAALAITGAIRGSSREKLYQELGLESLQQQRWYRKLCCFYKILKSQSPKYLYSIISIHNTSYRARQCSKIPAINVKHDFFKNTFFPSTIIEWNKLDWEIKNSESIVTFKKRILSFIRPSANSTINCHNPRRIKLLSRLRLGLSHLREHRFKHSFQDSLKPFCSCGKDELETSSHYLLHCSNYSEERLAHLNTIKNSDMSILQQSDSKFTSALLFGDTSFDNNNHFYPRCHYRFHHLDRKI